MNMLQRFGEMAPEREVKFAPVDLKSVAADGTFSGYASLFGTVDLGQDLVMPGVFRESLSSRGARKSWAHGRGQGRKPRRQNCLHRRERPASGAFHRTRLVAAPRDALAFSCFSGAFTSR